MLHTTTSHDKVRRRVQPPTPPPRRRCSGCNRSNEKSVLPENLWHRLINALTTMVVILFLGRRCGDENKRSLRSGRGFRGRERGDCSGVVRGSHKFPSSRFREIASVSSHIPTRESAWNTYTAEETNLIRPLLGNSMARWKFMVNSGRLRRRWRWWQGWWWQWR